MLRKIVVSLFVLIALFGCDEKSSQTSKPSEPVKRVWIFAQFNVPEEGDQIESYWYYGRITDAMYQDLSSNNISEGFIRLADVHFWGNDDKVHPYEDEEFTGEMLFKIEDLRKVTLVKRLPVMEDQHERNIEKLAPEEEPEPETSEKTDEEQVLKKHS